MKENESKKKKNLPSGWETINTFREIFNNIGDVLYARPIQRVSMKRGRKKKFFFFNFFPRLIQYKYNVYNIVTDVIQHNPLKAEK